MFINLEKALLAQNPEVKNIAGLITGLSYQLDHCVLDENQVAKLFMFSKKLIVHNNEQSSGRI
jgi:hypothetical protein